MRTVKYQVRTPFKYDGKRYDVGDEWTPSGGKYDEILMSSPRYFVRVEEPTTKPARRGRKAATTDGDSG